ncbi:hypothetical protein chiPu_0018279 [Chiloscyllium punctatum]|uniref:Uncharacterized protein n=1 Tax=Chiloscyllium punctatum TaxID=137246 RepID=A0A401RM64_CHIPU|nr:hypothetical protein [Chiloscyllium punctatum]
MIVERMSRPSMEIPDAVGSHGRQSVQAELTSICHWLISTSVTLGFHPFHCFRISIGSFRRRPGASCRRALSAADMNVNQGETPPPAYHATELAARLWFRPLGRSENPLRNIHVRQNPSTSIGPWRRAGDGGENRLI